MTLSEKPRKRKHVGVSFDETVTEKRARLQDDTNSEPDGSLKPGTDLLPLAQSLDTGSKLANAALQSVYDRITQLVLSLSAIDSSSGGGGEDDRDALLTKVAQLVLSAQRGRQIYQLLSPSSSTRRIRSALNLLSVLSMCSGGAAVAMLTSLRFERGQLPAVALMRSTAHTNDVRAAFVTLVLSLFVEQAEGVVAALLAGRTSPLVLLMTSMAGDRSSTISLVLRSFTSALLENASVGKREKLCVFNLRNMSTILQLYNWRGHSLSWRFSKRFHKKRRRDPVSERVVDTCPVDEAELVSVRRCVHEFLLLLFTSHRHGIAFRDPSLGTSDSRCNSVVFEMLKALPRPWYDPLIAQLVTSTLRACPDLIVAYLATFNGQLNWSDRGRETNKSNDEAEWRSRLEFIESIILGIDLFRPSDADGGSDAIESEADEQCGEVCERECDSWSECQLSWAAILPVTVSCLFPQCLRAALLSVVVSGSASPLLRTAAVRVLAGATRRLLSWRRQVTERRVREQLSSEVLALLPSSSDLHLSLGLLASSLDATAVNSAGAHTGTDATVGSGSSGGATSGSGSSGGDYVDTVKQGLLICAELIGLCCTLNPCWLQTDTLLARLWSLTGSLVNSSDVAQLRARVEAYLVPVGSSATPSALQDQFTLLEKHGGGNDEIALRTERIVSDILEECRPISSKPVSQSDPVDVGTPSRSKSKSTSLSQYVDECFPALSETPPDMATLQRWNDARLATLFRSLPSDAETPVAQLSSFVKLLASQALSSDNSAHCLTLLIHLKAVAGLLSCGRRVSAAHSVSAEQLMLGLIAERRVSERLLNQQSEEVDAGLAADNVPIAESVRERLVEVLLTLVGRCRHGCKSSHVALYLSAYGASLSRCDQLLFRLICAYERPDDSSGACQSGGVSLHQFRPMVWGRAAALDHYSEVAACGQHVLRLLQPERLELTCRRLPLDLSLSPATLLPPPTDADRVFDPRFLLALLLQLTDSAGGEVPEPVALLESGVLGVIVCLLGCRQAPVRVAACSVLAQIHTSLCRSRRRRRYRQLWLAVVQLFRAAASGKQESGDVGEGAVVHRLPFVTVYTWSRLLLILNDPGHRLFALTCRHVLRCAAAGTLHPAQVPLFFELFNSRDLVAHAAHRDWLLECVTQSMRSPLDYSAIQRTTGYKLVMGVAGSHAVGGASSRPRLLALLTASVRVPAILWRLERQHSLCVWLSVHVTSLFNAAGSIYRTAVQCLAVALVDSVKQLGNTGVASTTSFLSLCVGTKTFLMCLSDCSADAGPFHTRVSTLLDEIECVVANAEKRCGLSSQSVLA